MPVSFSEPLPFVTDPEIRSPSIGRVHADGSITFRGRDYRTIKQLPPECRALRADLAMHVTWCQLYRAIDPKRKRPAEGRR